MRHEPHPSGEEAYRLYFLRADAVQAAIAIGVLAVAQASFTWNDHVLFGSTTTFYQLLTLRAVVVAVCAYSAAAILGAKRSSIYDRWLFLATLLLAAASGLAVWTRPPEYLGHAGPTGVLAVCLYVVVPGALAPRAFNAVIISATSFVPSFLYASGPVIGRNALILTHVFCHLIGVLTARRMDAVRRQSYAARVEERRVREELSDKARALQAAKERAEELARVKSDFLATMSHELRTPMNAVIGLSELLSDGPLPEEQKEQARILHESATGLLAILNDILDLAKIDAGRMKLADAPFEVRALVRSVLDLFRNGAEERGLTLAHEIDEGVPAAVRGDATRLRQVISNLVSNALKFTEHGGVVVRVSSQRVEGSEADHVLSIRVEDTGPGITPETLARLFSPFEQGDMSSTRRYGGTGLGLAISRRLVEAMSGAIVVESEVGKGSTFEISLRATEAEPPAQDAFADAPLALHLPLRILVADDNAVNRRVALAMLARLGYRADVVEHGAKAVEATLRSRYDVVFLDLRMPEMDGFEAARRIRARFKGDEGPRLVALTASAFDEDRAACREAGMEDVVTKPMQLNDLRRALLRTQRQKTPPPTPVPVLLANTSPSDPPSLDTSALDKLRELEEMTGDVGFTRGLCAQFLADAGPSLDKLRAAAASNDARTVEIVAHNLKSSSAFVGAARFSKTCAEIEREARRGEIAGASDRVVALRAELLKVEAELLSPTLSP